MTSEPAPESGSILPPRARRERMRLEMVTAILEASREVMRERGVAGLSLREVARRVHLQAPSLYAYFPSKSALYDALYLHAIRRYHAYKERAEREPQPFWDRFAVWFTTYLRFAQENPELYQLAFERPVPGFRPSEESMAESSGLLGRMDLLLQEAIDAGWIRPHVSAAEARNLIIAMTHGLTSQHMANEPELPIGSGRYGSLIPAAVALFRAAWEPARVHAAGEPGGADP